MTESEGLVDIHCHGGGGHEFGVTVEGTLAAVDTHRQAGTHQVVASLASMPLEETRARLGVLRAAMAEDPALVGVHLEGPFLAPARRGAHALEALAVPDPALVGALLEAGDGILRVVTLAPELPGALAAVEQFAEAGVVVAVGHTDCTAAAAREAFDAGARLLTHACNAMPPIAARAPGPVAAALVDERVRLEVIADGLHVAAEVLRLLFAAAPDRIVLVSDAMSAAGVGDGAHRLGGVDVEVRDGRATIAGTDTLAGSTLLLARAVEVAVAAGVPQTSAHRAASVTPRAVLGLGPH